MKRVTYVIMVLAAILFTSCSEDEHKKSLVPITAEYLVNTTWEKGSKYFVSFNEKEMFVFQRSSIDGSITEKYWATYSIKDGVITYKYNYGNEYKLKAYKWSDDDNVLLLDGENAEDNRLDYFYGALDLFAHKYIWDL